VASNAARREVDTPNGSGKSLKAPLGLPFPVFLVIGFLSTISCARADSPEGHRRVFVFRHCFRSTPASSSHAVPEFEHMLNYTNKGTLPPWNTPTKWCTEGGWKISSGTGSDLASRFVPDGGTVSIISDTSMRCSDTALAILRGLGEGVRPIHYDAPIFHALEPDVGPAACQASFTDDDLVSAARERLDTVPTPTEYSEAYSLFERLLGIGVAGPLGNLSPVASVSSSGHLFGVVGALKRLSQMLFYSYASGAPWVSGASTDDLYNLIAWQHYFRSVNSINVETATNNAQLLKRILNTLGSTDSSDTTIFVGHDSNIDGMATLLNLNWEAPPYKGGALLPSPPNSGFLFDLDLGTGNIEISFVYPVVVGPGGSLNDTGILEASDITTEKNLESLIERGNQGLKRYPGAYECFEKTPLDISETSNTCSDQDGLVSSGYKIATIILSIVLGFSIILYIFILNKYVFDCGKSNAHTEMRDAPSVNTGNPTMEQGV